MRSSMPPRRASYFDDTEGLAFKFDDAHSFVIELCLVTVDVSAQVSVHASGFCGPPQKPVREANPVGSQGRTGPRPLPASHPKTIPHVGEMLLTLLDEMDLAEGAGVCHFFRLDVFRGKEERLSIKQQHPHWLARLDHPVGLV